MLRFEIVLIKVARVFYFIFEGLASVLGIYLTILNFLRIKLLKVFVVTQPLFICLVRFRVTSLTAGLFANGSRWLLLWQTYS